ncbi:hypothetical protein MMC17_003716 [Xylographa soralifera]|nr:hypothetical protein [Xylographa soralifera]
MPGHTLRRTTSTPLLQKDQNFLRRTASAPGPEMGPSPWELPTETTTTASARVAVAGVTTTTSGPHLLRLHDQLAANFVQLSIAIEQIKALEAQLATGNRSGTSKGAKLERKLAGHREHRDSLGTQRRRLLGKTDRAELSWGRDLRRRRCSGKMGGGVEVVAAGEAAMVEVEYYDNTFEVVAAGEAHIAEVEYYDNIS